MQGAAPSPASAPSCGGWVGLARVVQLLLRRRVGATQPRGSSSHGAAPTEVLRLPLQLSSADRAGGLMLPLPPPPAAPAAPGASRGGRLAPRLLRRLMGSQLGSRRRLRPPGASPAAAPSRCCSPSQPPLQDITRAGPVSSPLAAAVRQGWGEMVRWSVSRGQQRGRDVWPPKRWRAKHSWLPSPPE